MADWAEKIVEGAARRSRLEREAEEKRIAELDAAEAGQPTKAEAEEARRKAIAEAEQQRAEALAARVQEAQRRRGAAAQPMSDWARQTAAQALGPQWDHYDGPPAA